MTVTIYEPTISVFEIFLIIFDFLAVIGVSVTVFIAFRAMKAQNTLELVNFLQNEDVRVSRAHVITKLRWKKEREKWTQEDMNHADRVCSSYAIAARSILPKYNFQWLSYVDSKVFYRDWGKSIILCYAILEKHIEERKNNDPDYWNGFWELDSMVKDKKETWVKILEDKGLYP